MNADAADLTEYRVALAFVWDLSALLHPAPVGPFEDVGEMVALVERLADTHVGNAAALFHLWLRWGEGGVLAGPLEWVLLNVLLRHPREGEGALAAVRRRVTPLQAQRLWETFGEDAPTAAPTPPPAPPAG
ncbi:hypothetical protein V3W47_06265 [Deinococcus sp. YIM 134068]|uniref:hypothetical protein n=1 Tax=Deinococcus lichenicola TaxID=3118910 RepID=UPI002F92B8E0